MAQAIHVRLDAHYESDTPVAADARAMGARLPAEVRLTIYEDMAAAEPLWRAFERQADGTVFQSYQWLAAWQRHVGARQEVRPAIVIAQDASGAPLALFALAVRRARFARELIWLGSELCDYNGPLLAPGFAERFDGARFRTLWDDIERALQAHPRLGYDLINLSKMPERVGAQADPMLHLPVSVNPSGAYRTKLGADWESFYAAKRSAATRRRDRTKRKRLSDLGAVVFVTPDGGDAVLDALDTLMAQKARSFARMGVGNLFALPGYAEFYRSLAADFAAQPLVHISRLDVGATPAAVNLGLIYRGCYYYLLASYDDGEAARFGPGAAHLHEIMRYAIERGCAVFDFTIGDESYKRDWCDSELVLYDHIAAASWRGALVAMPLLALQRLKRRIKRTPALWSLASKARALAGALKR